MVRRVGLIRFIGRISCLYCLIVFYT